MKINLILIIIFLLLPFKADAQTRPTDKIRDVRILYNFVIKADLGRALANDTSKILGSTISIIYNEDANTKYIYLDKTKLVDDVYDLSYSVGVLTIIGYKLSPVRDGKYYQLVDEIFYVNKALTQRQLFDFLDTSSLGVNNGLAKLTNYVWIENDFHN